MIEGLNDRGVNKSGLNDKGLNEEGWNEVEPFQSTAVHKIMARNKQRFSFIWWIGLH